MPSSSSVGFALIISEFTQQDGRKKRTAKHLCVTNVTGLLRLTQTFSGPLQKKLFKGK